MAKPKMTDRPERKKTTIRASLRTSLRRYSEKSTIEEDSIVYNVCNEALKKLEAADALAEADELEARAAALRASASGAD